MTLGTYSHVTPSVQEAAATLVDEILTPIAVDLNTKYDYKVSVLILQAK